MKTTSTQLIAPGLIDSRLKLHIIMLFCHHRRLCVNVGHVREWLCELPWEIDSALQELADHDLLERFEQHGQPHYCRAVHRAHQALLDQLAAWYDDPHERDELVALVRHASHERQFRAMLLEEHGGDLGAVMLSDGMTPAAHRQWSGV